MLYDYITFTCEAYGYSSPSASFSWAVPGNRLPVTMDTLAYILTTTNGNNKLQNGGSTVINSIISSLYFQIPPTEKNYGNYTCSYGVYSATASLQPPPITAGMTIYGNVSL